MKIAPSTPQARRQGFVLAWKAFGIATVLCVGTASIAALGVAKWLHVSSIQEFSDKCRHELPRRVAWLHKAIHANDQPMTPEEDELAQQLFGIDKE
jgi:uncharacterized membrane protein YidH (DUF202 family)